MSENNEKELNSNPTDNDDSKSERQIISPLEALGLFESINQRFSDQSKYLELKTETQFNEAKREFSDKYEKDRRWVRRSRWIQGIIISVFLTALSIGFWQFTEWSKKQIKRAKDQVVVQLDDLDADVKLLLEKLDDEFSGQIDSIRAITNEQVDSVRIRVEEKIIDEFRTDRIASLIDEHTKRYVEEESKSSIHEQVNSTIRPYLIDFEQLLDSTKSDLENLSKLARVRIIAEKAINGSKSSFDDLCLFVNDTSEIGNFAAEKVKEVVQNLMIYKDTPKGMRFSYSIEKNGKSVGISELSIKEIASIMERPNVTHAERHSAMADIYEKHQIRETYIAALDILENSDSLPTCAAFCGVLRKIYDGEIPSTAIFLAFDYWEDICREELAKLENQDK